jgi:hypothetical protein
LNIESLSDVPLYAGRPQRQVPAKRKAAGWMIVGLVNLVVFNLFIFSQTWPDRAPFGRPSELTMDLRGMTPSPLPEQQQVIVPEPSAGTPPEVVPEPIIIPPPVVQMQPEEQQRGITDGDLLGAVGREVACSAGNFENLTMAQRNRCSRNPWLGVRMPDGSIVLTARPPPNRFFEEENARPPEVRISGADANRNRIEGANDGCPVILNTPCFNRIPGRN